MKDSKQVDVNLTEQSILQGMKLSQISCEQDELNSQQQFELLSNEHEQQSGRKMEEHESFMQWIKQQNDLEAEQSYNQPKKSLKAELPLQKQQEDDYEQFKHSKQKYFGIKILSPQKIDQQVDKHLYRKINPRKYNNRNIENQMFFKESVQIQNKSQIQEKLKIQGKQQFIRKQSSHKYSSTTRPSTSKTCNKSYYSNVPHTSRKVCLQQIKDALYDSEIDFSKEKDSEKEANEEVPDYYRPKKLMIQHIRPPKIQLLRKEFRWWPLETLQKEILKRYIDNDDSDDDNLYQTYIPSSFRKSFESKRNSNQNSRILSQFKQKDQNINDLGKTIHLIRKCDNYLSHSANVKGHLKQQEKQFNTQFNLFELSEDESNERQYIQEQQQYEKEESNAVIQQFKKHATRKLSQKLYNSDKKKQFKTKVRKLLEAMR